MSSLISKKMRLVTTLAKCIGMILVVAAHGDFESFARASDSTDMVQKILRNLETTRIPRMDVRKKSDEVYLRQFLASLREATEKRDALILELYEAAPEHERIPALMAERWSVRPYAKPGTVLVKEIDEVLGHTQNPKLKIEGAFARTYLKLYDSRDDGPVDLSEVEAFLRLTPKDPRGAPLLQLASQRTRDQGLKYTLEERILKEFPETLHTRRLVGGRNQRRLIGQTLALEFKDAISGSAVSLKQLKGKVVVIDFWATWCVPCVTEMPKMKDLYTKYHNLGVEFIGVSLDRAEDEGGLASLKSFVQANHIPWPQYYQGNGWESDFSCSCGIDAIPAVFVIDAEGRVVSTAARDKLETLIPELLKEASAKGEATRTLDERK